jgi:1,4-dihydroxy-2-naphthoyl-CoA hydrolase
MDLKQIAAVLLPLPPDRRADLMTRSLFGHDAALGVRFTHVDSARVAATMEVSEAHVQPYGLVHGGVYCALGETTCSVGAALSVMGEGRNAVGSENRTRFHRGARPGTTLSIEALPVSASDDGRWLTWEARITDSEGRLCAVSRVTAAVLDPGRRIAGRALEVPPMDLPEDP